MNKITKGLLTSGLLFAQSVMAHGPLPPTMQGAPIPPVPGLTDGSDPIITNNTMAIALGKALFWDVAAGSDGMACASCHFHAGADRRVKNQLNPGQKSLNATGQTFEATVSDPTGGPNYTLNQGDFPFHSYHNPFDNLSGISQSSDDVVASSGTFSGEFISAPITGDINDNCARSADTTFRTSNNAGTRRVEPRNTPTVINAVFNHRNFWDGRANNVFNGSSMWGDRDTHPDTGVWVKTSSRSVEKQRLHLINSSLASQALAPPMSDVEMGCRDRTFPAIGRKMLMRRPLAEQNVHHEDSVLGSLSLSSAGDIQAGLNTTYTAMVRKAFNKKYWSFRRRGSFGRPASGLAYNQMEANFGMFFALAIQAYESTLVSDQAPIDNFTRDADFFPVGMTDSQRRGLDLFTEFHCNICHAGPSLTSAAITTNAMMLEADPAAFGPMPISQGAYISRNIVNYDITVSGTKLHDFGFFNTGVGDPDADHGVFGTDDFGNSLSFVDQYTQHLAGTANAITDPSAGIETVRSCDFSKAFALNLTFPIAQYFTQVDGIIADPNGNTACLQSPLFAFIPTPAVAAAELANPATNKLATAQRAAFKAPSLRNIELTGPYMHNGSMATLGQVIEFYSRGGNFDNTDMHKFVFPMGSLQNDQQARDDLIAFLLTFTDDRVRFERAPFDHPELSIPNGHEGDHINATTGNPLNASLAKDQMLTVPAVGAGGLANPILPFNSYLAP